jgi:hypothetical protein
MKIVALTVDTGAFPREIERLPFEPFVTVNGDQNLGASEEARTRLT